MKVNVIVYVSMVTLHMRVAPKILFGFLLNF